MADSFLSHADNLAGGSTIVLAALDVPSHVFCTTRQVVMKHANLQCLDLSSWIPRIASQPGSHGIRNGNAGTDSCTYLKAVWAKPIFLSHASKASPQGALLMDLDVVLAGNLPEYIQKHRSPGALMMAQNEYDNLPNSGIVWASSASGDIMDRWISQGLKLNDKISVRAANGCEQPMGCPPGDMDFLFDVVKEDEKSSSWLQLMPQKVANKEGRPGELASHYTGGDKILRMQHDHKWEPRLHLCK